MTGDMVISPFNCENYTLISQTLCAAAGTRRAASVGLVIPLAQLFGVGYNYQSGVLF